MWFCLDSCGDIETFDTAEKAKAAAESALRSERFDSEDGWSEDVTNIMWGKVLGTCELEFSRPRTEDDHSVSSECETICDYHIVDVSSEFAGSNEATRAYSAPEKEDGECVGVGGLAVECGSYAAPDPRTRLQKLRDRAFPSRHCFAPESPSEFKDCIHGHAITKLSWADRFRVLMTGVVVTSWRTATENEVGRTINAATCHVGTAKDLIR